MRKTLIAHRRCEGCGETFQTQRRNQAYHNQTCKQHAYYQRTKRQKNFLRNALVLPVLSLFPGIGLLDRAFEECGLTVVRGPDLLWGSDIRDFHLRPGHFGGIIGGPPCQAFSKFRYIVQHHGYKSAPNLIPEFERCVHEAQPVWFMMENVPDAPLPEVTGYRVHSQLLNNRQAGGIQNRVRRISFGTHDGRQLVVPKLPEPEEWAPTVCASGGVKPGIETADRKSRLKFMGWKTKEAFQQICRLQGLPEDFELPNFTIGGAIKAVGNGVPLPLGRAIARSVRQAMSLDGIAPQEEASHVLSQ